MNERIGRLLEYVKTHNLFPEPVKYTPDPFDDNLAEPVRIAKRLTDYMLSQPVILHEASELAGLTQFREGAPEPADLFPRAGHSRCAAALARYYRKPQENLCTMEWQHSNPDLGKAVRIGLKGYVREINESRKRHAGDPERLFFLTGMELFIQGLEQRIEQYRAYCVEESGKNADPERKRTLRRMARNLERVPANPAESFEEAVQTVFICWQCLSDSLGRPDQYLWPYYKRDMEKGILTREHAKELLQELFLTIHRYTKVGTFNDDKGGESHFVVGGYTIDHEDGFNDLSELIVESMMELPAARPQVSLRWNEKTPFSVLKKMMDYERKDPFKRVAFVNDEPRIKAMREIMGLPWETAYDYIMVGCNEPAFQGGISLGGNTTNILRSMTDVLSERKVEVLECATFDEFYTLWEKVLDRNLESILAWSNKFNVLRAGDCNVMSSLFLEGCIERAQSATRGGAVRVRTGWNFMGGTNLIDSLCIIKQFVFDEKRVTMPELLEALEKDWQGFEELRLQILRDGRFFGNNDDLSNAMARRVNQSLYDFAAGRLNLFGDQIMFGNLTGYHPHFAWFGALTGATPDGRIAGSALAFGSGQSEGKDREGITSHLLSVAQWDPTGIMSANTIMNLTMERAVVEDEESFDKFVHLVETYFRLGGLHLQLNYLSAEELLKAKASPQEYKSLRVRVSGFSAYFTKLVPEIQDNVIARTVGKM